MEYVDLGVGLKSVAEILNFETFQWKEDAEKCRLDVSTFAAIPKRCQTQRKVYQVRPSAVCVVGRNSRAVMKIKDTLAQSLDAPLAIESFHVHRANDIKDGAMLVPRIILVATHCPGKKLLDEEGEQGQLDALYDEALEAGAELVIIYMDLPQTLYPPLTHGLYHDNVARLLFPSQPLLRFLALRHSFLTISEHSNLNPMQKELLLNWISTPVPRDHPVYARARSLAAKCAEEFVEGWTRQINSARERRATESNLDTAYIEATEEHPLVDARRPLLFGRRTLGDVFGTGRYALRDAISRRNYGTLDSVEDVGLGSNRITRSASTDDRLALLHMIDDTEFEDVEMNNNYHDDVKDGYQRQPIRTDYV